MRTWHRCKTLLLLLSAIILAGEVSAQNMPGYPSYGAPAYSAGPPQGYPASAGQGAQSFQSHPMISPFDNAFEQHFSSDGLWFKRALSGMSNLNDYYFNVDYTRTKSRNLHGLFGRSDVPTFDQLALLGNAETTRGDSVTFPDAFTLPSFPLTNIGQVGAAENQGVRLSGGIKNQTGWRFAWNVGYNGSSTNVWDARARLERERMHFSQQQIFSISGGVTNGPLPGNLLAIDERKLLEDEILGARVFDSTDTDIYAPFGSVTSEILDRHLMSLGSIGINTGEAAIGGNSDGFGTVQTFDLDFILSHKVQSYGTGFHFSSSPIYESGKFQIRPILGARYFRLLEGVAFVGVDSGLDYVANVPNGLDEDGDGIIDNVGENGTLTFADPVTDDTTQILVRSFVNSNVRSSMAGPEAGIEYEIAKKKDVVFHGSTRVGALVNSEKMDLAGDNIINRDSVAVDLTDPAAPTIRDQAFPTDTLNGQLTQNAFTDTAASTHISPMFEQSLNAELPIFSKIPLLRDVWQLEHAKLRLGWTYTWIGEVADPNQSWVANTNPIDGLFPSLKVRRSIYFQNQFNVGINWEF